jgi:YHS domain-containing protein
MQPQLPSQPQAGAYDPRGYQPQVGQQPQRESVDLNSSFQPAGAPAPAYGDPRIYCGVHLSNQEQQPYGASQPMQPQQQPNGSAPPMYGQNSQGQNGPAAYGGGVYGGEQTPAMDARRDVRLSEAPPTSGGYGQPALPPRQETQNQQWQSNPTVAGASGASVAPPAEYGARQPVAPQQEIRSDISVAAAPTSNPPLGLDGHCPVSVLEQSKWVKGDVRYGAIHRGRTYLFASQAEQQRFLGNPDKYSPMLSGYDPIKYLEEGVLVEGKRSSGMVYEGRMYLFADLASLQRMEAAPQDRQKQLANAVQHAMQQSITPVVRR